MREVGVEVLVVVVNVEGHDRRPLRRPRRHKLQEHDKRDDDHCSRLRPL